MCIRDRSPQSSRVSQVLGAETTRATVPSGADTPPVQGEQTSPAQQSVEGSGPEGGAESVIKLDPGKSKGGSLRDRPLQFPLCEKALAFKLRPGSKESLLSLGQFNCCHVI